MPSLSDQVQQQQQKQKTQHDRRYTNCSFKQGASVLVYSVRQQSNNIHSSYLLGKILILRPAGPLS